MNKVKKLVKGIFDTLIKRPVLNYNVEERAYKAISVPKREAAPKHLTTEEKIMKYIEEHPELKDIVVDKPKSLIEWLKNVKVISHGVPETELVKTDKSKLPTKRDTYTLPHMFGEIEPKVIPKGKISLQRTTNLVLEYASSKEKPKPIEIAEKYGLEEEDASNLVRHFKAFELYRPASETGDYSGLPPWAQSVGSVRSVFAFLDEKPPPDEDPKLLPEKTKDKQKVIDSS